MTFGYKRQKALAILSKKGIGQKMWILIVLQIMAGSATAKSSLPVTYSGVVMQEFSSKESCLNAKKTIEKMSSESTDSARQGLLSLQCIEK